jgi:TRAP transporter TAXI family solute receptor
MSNCSRKAFVIWWKTTRRFILGLLACLVICGVACAAWAKHKGPARISVLIATGMPGGTYYQVGLGMASLWTTRLRDIGIRVSAAISEGSMENIEAIRISDADMILAENLFCSMAYNGTGIYKGQPLPDLRSITTLWPDTVHLLIRADRIESGTLEDLKGLTIATGLPDSGNRFTTELLLKTLKAGPANVRLRSMSNKAAAEALRRGQVEGADLTGGIPVPMVTTLFSEGAPPLTLLNITDSQLEAVREEGWPHAFRQTIPADTYPGQEKPVQTVGQMNLLAVTASLNPQVVYALTKALYENLDYLVRVHPACRHIVIEKALQGLSVPLHPGAIRYYREKKIKIPEHLIP